MCYAIFDMKRRMMTLTNSGLPYPSVLGDGGRANRASGCSARIVRRHDLRRGVILVAAGEVYVFCTDGVSEAMNELDQEFTPASLIEVVGPLRELPAAKIVAAIFQAVGEWRGDAAPNDDMTAVVVRITA